MVKVRVNDEVLLPTIKRQRHPLDGEYVRVKDGFYAYKIENPIPDADLNIELVFWKVALHKLRLRLYLS